MSASSTSGLVDKLVTVYACAENRCNLWNDGSREEREAGKLPVITGHRILYSFQQ